MLKKKPDTHHLILNFKHVLEEKKGGNIPDMCTSVRLPVGLSKQSLSITMPINI